MRINAGIGGGNLSYAEAMANAGVSPSEEMTRMLKEGGLAAGETMATVASVGDWAAAREIAGGLAKAGLSAVRNAERGLAVIGPRATYREFAKGIGAKFLNVTDEAWTWEKNRRFLYGVVQRGDDVVFAGKFNPAKLDPDSVLAREIKYLIDHGYTWEGDFARLVKR